MTESQPVNHFSSPNSRPRVLAGAAVWSLFFLSFAIATLVVGYETAMHFNGVAIDGPFQLYNALRRIQAGFRPGVDFQFFHGLGVPYLHYWLYRLLGGGLRGSELARELLATTLYPTLFVIVFRAFAGSWTKALAMAAAAMAASYLLHMSSMLFAVSGMLSLRSALPTLLPVVFLANPTRNRRIVAVGLTLGLALFISTEQGLAASMAYVFISLLAVVSTSDRRGRILETLATLGVAVAMLMAALLAVGGIGGLRGALRFNFVLVPMDQYWYFGAPPNVFVPSWGEGVRMLAAAPVIGLTILLAIAAVVWYSRQVWTSPREELAQRPFALAFLSMYGLVSCASLLGVFTMSYVQPCLRVLLIIALVEGSRLAAGFDARHGRSGVLGVPTWIAVAASGLCVYAMATISLVPTALTTSLPHILRDHASGRQRFSMVGIWPETLREAQSAIDAHRSADGKPPTLWSTYAGWIEAQNGIFNPSTDYIIHALGPQNRANYLNTLRATKPALIQTIRPTYTIYERWLENNDWPVYDEVLDSYQVYSMTPWSVIWERRSTPADRPHLVGALAVPNGTTSVQLPTVPGDAAAAATLLEVEIDYTTTNRLKALPLVGNSPRFLIGISGALSRIPISLSPFETRARFPLIVAPGQTPTLNFQVFSLLPGASLKPIAIRLFVRPLDNGSSAWMSNLLTALHSPN